MNQSSTPRPGNLLRAEWRTKCRQVLADHLGQHCARHKLQGSCADLGLESSLGISVLPSDVRLIPDDGDAYNWIRHPERDHLFSKQLSKHSVGAYTELCREVGKSFKAVHKVCATTEVGIDALQVCQTLFFGRASFQLTLVPETLCSPIDVGSSNEARRTSKREQQARPRNCRDGRQASRRAYCCAERRSAAEGAAATPSDCTHSKRPSHTRKRSSSVEGAPTDKEGRPFSEVRHRGNVDTGQTGTTQKNDQ